MNRALVIAASLAGLLVSGIPAYADPAAADPAATTPAATAAPADSSGPNPDTIVCRREAPMVGTRLGALRHCKTQREWDQERADAQKALTDSQHTFSPGR